jgi:hypothetical protein
MRGSLFCDGPGARPVSRSVSAACCAGSAIAAYPAVRIVSPDLHLAGMARVGAFVLADPRFHIHPAVR